MHTVTKQYRDLPAAHRQPFHDGHCRLIHGHNWGFDLTFACDKLDENGFVIDVGKLKNVKEFLEYWFDHTLLLNSTDPEVVNNTESFQGWQQFSAVRIVQNCGMEGLAEMVWHTLELPEPDVRLRKLRIVSVTCHEDGKNSATYCPLKA